jgi:hypothetical protein
VLLARAVIEVDRCYSRRRELYIPKDGRVSVDGEQESWLQKKYWMLPPKESLLGRERAYVRLIEDTVKERNGFSLTVDNANTDMRL